MYAFPNTISVGFDFADGSGWLYIWIYIEVCQKEYLKMSITSWMLLQDHKNERNPMVSKLIVV